MLSAVTSAAARAVWEQVWDYLSLTKHLKTNKNQSRLCLLYFQPVFACVCVCLCVCMPLPGWCDQDSEKNGGKLQVLAALHPSSPGDVCVGQQGLRLLPWRNRFLPMAVSLDGSSLGIQTGSPCSSHYTCAVLPCVRSLRLD